MSTFLLALAFVAQQTDEIDWRVQLQKPFAELPSPRSDLPPILKTSDGKRITTRPQWDKARAELRAASLLRLGPAPAKPANLDVRSEKTELLDGYVRTLLSFRSEGASERISSFRTS